LLPRTSTVYNLPEADPIRRHAPYNATEITPAQLADTGLATDQEVVAIDFLLPRLRDYQQTLIQASTTAAPNLVPIMQTSIAAGEGDVSALKAHKMTWGEYNTHRRDRALKSQQQINAELQRQS
jgi:hypothetical protein